MSTDDPTLFTTLKGHKDTITGLSFHPGLYVIYKLYKKKKIISFKFK